MAMRDVSFLPVDKALYLLTEGWNMAVPFLTMIKVSSERRGGQYNF